SSRTSSRATCRSSTRSPRPLPRSPRSTFCSRRSLPMRRTSRRVRRSASCAARAGRADPPRSRPLAARAMALDVPRIDRSASPADARLGAGGMTAIDIERSPVVAIWEVTRACDLACRHCRACAVVERSPRELTGAEAFDLIEQVAELAPGVLVLTGGDPLKRDDIFEIVARAASRGLRVAVAPSVTPLLTADAIARLAAAGAVRIALS